MLLSVQQGLQNFGVVARLLLAVSLSMLSLTSSSVTFPYVLQKLSHMSLNFMLGLVIISSSKVLWISGETKDRNNFHRARCMCLSSM